MPGSNNLSALDTAVSEIETEEHDARTAEARRLRMYANLYAVAEREAAEQAPRRIGGRVLSRGAVTDSLAYRSAVADVAADLHLTEHAVRARFEKAHELVAFYPATLEALESGSIAMAHVNVILDAARVLGVPAVGEYSEATTRRARYESLTVERGRETSASQLRPYAHRIAEELTEKSLDERHECEKARRRVWVEPADEGMSYLTAYLPAHHARGIYDRLSRIAKQIQQDEANAFGELRKLAAETGEQPPPDTRRSRDEIRADEFFDLLSLDLTDPKIASDLADRIEAGAGAPAVRGIVQVIVHKDHLDEGYDRARGAQQRKSSNGTAGAANGQVPLPELEGYGPIAVDTAREIAGHARHWIEATVDPATGDVETVTSRAPSAEQRRKLLVRDEHCRWPGCRTSGFRCDIDHTVAVEDGGPTAMNNLGFLCRHHHTLKHHGGWSVRQAEGAIYEFRSPTGRITYTKPESRVRFRSAEGPPDEFGEASGSHDPPPKPPGSDGPFAGSAGPPPGPAGPLQGSFEPSPAAPRPSDAAGLSDVAGSSRAAGLSSVAGLSPAARPNPVAGRDPGLGENSARKHGAGRQADATTGPSASADDEDAATGFPF